MTPPARAFLAAGTPGLARLPALVFFLLIGFALPQPAAAQNSVEVNLGPSSGTHTLSIADAAVTEGAGPARFMITLEPSSTLSLDFSISYTAGSADLEDLGTARPANISLATNSPSVILEVPIVDDELVEGEETFTVSLGLASATVQATGTITDDDDAPAVAPAITTQPTDQSVTVGETATFTVTATGTPTPTYQWRFEGTDISGATSATYTISSAALTNAGDYTVVVTNTAGAVGGHQHCQWARE